MKSSLSKDTLYWGLILWFIGYMLGVILIFFVPQSQVGWIIMPIGALFTLWVLAKKIHAHDMYHYLIVGIAWTIMAIALDYLMIVMIFNPSDGYYKLDIYMYYALTLLLPVLVGYSRVVKKQ